MGLDFTRLGGFIDWSKEVNIYCERLAPGLGAEPLNLATNLCFIIAAVLAARRQGNRWLCLLLLAIGIGSGLFHSFATRWAGLADTLPILIFILSFVFLRVRLRGVFKANFNSNLHAFAAGLFLLFLSWSSASFLRSYSLNGSQSYVGVLLFLLLFGIEDVFKNRSWFLLSSVVIFTLSLFFRSIDQTICESIPFGTHFLWHVCNSIVCYMAIMSLKSNN